MRIKIYYLVFFLFFFHSFSVWAQGDDITKEGKLLFPLGIYEMLEDEQKLKEIADAGFNIIRCDSKEALNRGQSVGLMGWMPSQLQKGAN